MNRQSGQGNALRHGLARASRAMPLPSLLMLGTVLLVFYAADRVLFSITRLSSEHYASSFIFGEFMAHALLSRPIGLALAAAILIVVLLSIRFRTLGPQWADISGGERLRLLVAVVVVVLTWAFATYGYNYYFDRLHVIDRLLLFLLAALVVWRPAFIFAYLLVLLPLVWQFNVPIGGFSWAEPALLVRVLILVAAAYATRLAARNLKADHVVFLTCCMIASHYWVSGIGKVAIGWPAVDHIAYLLPATYANGWLGFIAADTIGVWSGRLDSINWLLKAGTLVIECGAIVMLVRRSVTKLCLVGFICLHVGIFLVTGIFFWKWIVLNAVVLTIFFTTDASEVPIHSLPYFALSLVLIGGGSIWFRPQGLVWLDVPVSYTYRVTAESTGGETYRLPPAYFAPYDYQFTLGSFGYLSDDPTLDIVWGATRHRAVMDSLVRSPRAETVSRLESMYGRGKLDPSRRASLEEFVAQYVKNRQAGRRAVGVILGNGRAPAQLWTFPRRSNIPPGEPVEHVAIYRVTSLYDGANYLEIDTSRVSVITVPSR